MIVVTTTVIIAEKVSQIENKIISETSLNRKCEALQKLGKAHSYTSDIETVGKDSIVITDRNFEELGMQDVLFVKYGNGDWYPVNDDKRLSYFQVNRIVTNAYINLIWKNNN